ncbi:RHS repeat-associated core domain-containing protein [Flavobacterium sp.]|uniref:RHS repeat-associated core domain-containing protein n=1 Tax=Flavobacterium sp. TaxID=239 RepID=UPI0038FCD077
MKSRLLALTLFLANTLFSQNFHDTQGKLEISSSGHATYTLPIAMPPSIQSVGPIINLIYASGQPGGIAGQGWSINSISNISRMASRKDIDGFIDGVDYDADDKLAFDGQRLLLKSGTYWADGSVYETEIQSNTKIELKSSGATMYFIVTAPDGSRSWYGNYGGMNASDLNAFYIVRFEDANANFITYNYTKPYNKSLCISDINFSANTISNATPLNKILFTYELAARTENAYIKGVKVEKVEILKKIEVFTNNLLFKKYELTHAVDLLLGYQHVIKLQESNGLGELANPVIFDYDATQTDSGTETTKTFTNNIDFSKIRFTGDFDGDGRLDFVTTNQLFIKNFEGSSGPNAISIPSSNDISKLFSATTLTNNKLNQFQSIVKVDEQIDKINFKIYNYNPSNNLMENTYTKSILMDNIGYCESECQIACPSPTYAKTSNRYIEGDFNGDGISEVLIFENDENTLYQDLSGGGMKFPINCIPVKTAQPNFNVRLVDLNPNSSITYGQTGNLPLPNTAPFFILDPGIGYYLPGDKNIQVADFNGDGKMDIFISYLNEYKIFSLKESKNSPYIELEIIGQGPLDTLSHTLKLYGDYNGDGKTDIMVPQGDGSGNGQSLWEIYYSNPNPLGGVFFTKEVQDIVDYRPDNTGDFDQSVEYNAYYAIDTNHDGKTDLVKVWLNYYHPKCTINDHDTQWKVTTYANNIGKSTGSGFTFDFVSAQWEHCSAGCPLQPNPCFYNHWNDSPELVTPIVSNYKYDGLNREILLLRNHTNEITYINFTKDVSRDNTLLKVTQSGGAIVDEIEYKSMESSTGDLGLPSEFYSSENALDYPFVEIKKIATNKLVSRIKNTVMGVTRMQDFRYLGYVSHLDGLGILGFKKVARSSWYRNESDKKVWSISENDPLQRGAMVRSFSQLLNMPFVFSTSYTTGLMSKTENTFTQTTDSISKRYIILLNKQTTTDYLTNVVSEKIYNTYTPDYFLPSKVTNNNYLGSSLQGTSISETLFANDVLGVGSNYYIGRPYDMTNTVIAYGDTQVSNEKYFYTGSNLIRTEKKANSSPETIVEAIDYFPNGNIQRKTTSATGTTATNAVSDRSTEFTYDITNRFVKTVKDVEGLITTNNTFDPLYGVVLSQTNPFGKSTTSIYDSWGKRTKVTDFLGKSITYTYAKASNIYTTTETGDDGSGSIIDSDALARVIRKASKDINGNWNYSNTEYDYLGRKYRVSEPYAAAGSPSLWTTSEFDDYDRVVKVTAPTGRITTMSYIGLTATSFDEVMTKTTTKNANGHLISSTDSPGGTILYTYNATGNLKESNYDGISLTMQYDLWGRKLSLSDPSAGVYNYTYNAYGETLTEATPKGLTSYTLNPVGKVLTKSVVGLTAADNTNIVSTYTYDPVYKWVTNIAVTNLYDGNSNYAYTYDVTGNNPTMQLKKTVETLPLVTFTKEVLTFDSFGRVETEISTATAHSKTSTKTIFNTYKNGAHWQIKDTNISGAVLWQANAVNARGQLTTATLGNGIGITNTYDIYGFPTQLKHDKSGTTPVNIMTLNTVFEPKRGNLTSRYNSMFDVNESFVYDTLDRLTTWDGIATNLMTLPFNTTTDGFTFTGTSTTGSVTNVTGTMKVVLKNTFVAAQKPLTTINVVTGNKLRVKATITGKTGTSGVIVGAVMVETDPLDALNYVEIPFGTVNNGVFDANYTASDFVTNPKLTLKFIVDESSPDGSNGGGTIAPNTTFFVDNLTIDNITVGTQSYDDRGRITQNDLGTYNYLNVTTKPYRQTSITPLTTSANSYYATRGNLNVTYNAFKSPIQIEEIGIDKLSFEYNAMQQRSAMYYGSTNTDKILRPYRKYYSADGSMEIKYTLAGSIVEFVTYIGGDAYSAPLLVKKIDNAAYNNYYLHRDYLGSIVAITNDTGAIVEKRHFDAWGNIIKVQDGSGNNLTKLTFSDRGYTGHEHLQSVGLIHMNGRLYDPKLHRFLQPDNYVQDPYNTQNYNRYGYVLNNPLKRTDPSGEEYGVGVAIIIAVAVAVATYTISALYDGTPFNVQGIVKTSCIAAYTAAMTFGIGEMTSTVSNFFVRASCQAVLHGGFNGGMSAIQGGKFWSGFAAGSVSSLASSAFTGGANLDANGNEIANTGFGGAGDFSESTAGLLASGTISGGAGSLIGGGNFWQGAVTGLVVSGLNHAMHQMDEPDNGYDKNGKQINNNGGDTTDYMYDDKGNIISSTSVQFKGAIPSSGDLRGYGFKGFRMASGAITDDSLNFTSNLFAVGEIYAGAKLTIMGLTTVSKSSLGIRVALGGSETTLKSSVYFQRTLGINYKMPWRLPTVMGVPTNNLGIFLGRNSSVIGAGLMIHGSNTLYNGFKP